MAEAFFNHVAEPQKLPVRADSAGLHPVLDDATEEAIIASREYSVDISSHHSQRLSQVMVQQATLILTMTAEHRRQVERVFPAARGKTFTLREFVGESGDIEDPYGQGLVVYRRCAQQIWAAVEKVVERLDVEKKHTL
jgi:protein-tyrosine-phosphatase